MADTYTASGQRLESILLGKLKKANGVFSTAHRSNPTFLKVHISIFCVSTVKFNRSRAKVFEHDIFSRHALLCNNTTHELDHWRWAADHDFTFYEVWADFLNMLGTEHAFFSTVHKGHTDVLVLSRDFFKFFFKQCVSFITHVKHKVRVTLIAGCGHLAQH